jgi:hypothetical protein
MQAQAVRVVVRLPYNRPEHPLADPVPVSQPANEVYKPGGLTYLGFMELGQRELPLGSCSEISRV